MAELMKKKKLTEVDVADAVSASAKILIANDGKVQQASVDEVLKVGTFIDESINNQFKVLSGTEIVATDSSKGFATDFSCVAKTEQKQYTGKNLLNIADLGKAYKNLGSADSYSVDDKSVTVNMASGAKYAFACLSFDNSLTDWLGKTVTISAVNNNAGRMIVGYYDGTSRNQLGSTEVGVTGKNSVTVTYDNTLNASGIPIVWFYAENATTPSVTYTDIQIEVGSTATDYEKFVGGTPSPNPSYPQAIMNSADCVELRQGAYTGNGGVFNLHDNYVCNAYPIYCKSGDLLVINGENIDAIRLIYRNDSGFISSQDITKASASIIIPDNVTHLDFALRNQNGVTPDTVGKVELTINNKYVLQVKSVNKNIIKNNVTSQTISGVTVTKNEIDGSITVNGTATAHISLILDDNVSLKSGNAYKLSGCPSGGTNTTYFLDICRVGVATYLIDIGNGFHYDCKADMQGLSARLRINSGTTVNNLTFKPMLRYSGTDDTYEPHKEHISTILLNEPLRAVNDVKDVIEYVNDGYKVRRKIVTRVLNGTEGFYANGSSNGLYRYDVSISNTSGKLFSAICSHFRMSNESEFGKITDVCFAVHPTNSTFCFWTNFATVDEFKAWLTSNPITVQYEAANEVIEEIADQTPFYNIPTYDGGTTISTTDRLQPQIEVEYPTAKAAGIASEGFAKGNLALEQIKALIASTATVTTTEDETEEVTA